MEQMQAFIKKASNDSGLMAKLDALGAGGTGPVEQFSTQREILTPAAECQELSMPNLGALDERPSAGVSERLTFGDKIVALAAEYGFTITAEDYRQAVKAAEARQVKAGELGEEDLEAVAGGWSENRYNPVECAKRDKANYLCEGLLGLLWCDHFAQDTVGTNRLRIKCAMGYFDYEITRTGSPYP